MSEKLTKKDYINEILRLNRVLIQMKCNAEDDKNIKRLIAENLANISKIEQKDREKREEIKAINKAARLARCVGG